MYPDLQTQGNWITFIQWR